MLDWPRAALALALLAALLAAGDDERAAQEARALAAVLALPDGPRREAGLRVVQAAWRKFREEASAAASAPPSDDETPRRAALRERQRSLEALRRLADELGRAAITGLVEVHLERWPLDDEARALLGLGLLAAGERDRALQALLAVLACDPGLSAEDGRELRGRLFLDHQDPVLSERAVADLAPCIARWLVRGVEALARGEAAGVERALAELEPLARAIRGERSQALWAALRADAAERRGEFGAALPLWRQAVGGSERPEIAARWRAGVRRARADDLARALAEGDAEALAELSPAFPERDDLQDRWFRLLLTQGRLAELRRAAEALLAADPEHPLAVLCRDGAIAALDARRLDLLPPVIARLRVAAPELGARFPVLYSLDAALSESGGDLAGALAALDRLLALRPDDRGARLQRARLRLRADDAAGCIADCEALLAQNADDVDALAQRALGRAAQRDRRALDDLDRVIALRPGPAALLTRARVRARFGEDPASDLEALSAAVRSPGETLLLMDALELTRDSALQRRLLERASALGNAEATLRLRRLR
ncbi:MAG: hypothetical protein N3B15_00975 [Planctomycetota bacterium]|nr:hypothetical protein [Planctomycetota bacterium]